MRVKSAHDVSDFCFAASGQWNTIFKRKRFQPSLYFYSFDFRQPVVPPARENPFPQVAIVGFLRGKRFSLFIGIQLFRIIFAEDVRQFMLPIMIHESPHANVLDPSLVKWVVDG